MFSSVVLLTTRYVSYISIDTVFIKQRLVYIIYIGKDGGVNEKIQKPQIVYVILLRRLFVKN